MQGQNSISETFDFTQDIGAREQSLLDDASRRTGFTARKLLHRSSWWTSGVVGAFHYLGNWQGRSAVLKVQGVRPVRSEVEMISAFAQSNASKIIRAPFVYAHIPWDESSGYEALVMEHVSGEKVVHKPTTTEEVSEYFALYKEYRGRCIAKPWVNRPDVDMVDWVLGAHKKWREAGRRIYPNHPGRRPDDEELLGRASRVLRVGYAGVDFEFMHGHFSADDLYRAEDGQFVLLSNLYWSWRPPFYDTVFAYHWFGYNIAQDVVDITPDQFDAQRNLWLTYVYAQARTDVEQRLLNLALLERAAAALAIDAFTVEPHKDIVEHVFATTREEVERLVTILGAV